MIKNKIQKFKLFVGVLHATSFEIQYKVGQVFSSVSFDGEDLAYSKYCYDDQFLKKLLELTKLLKGNPRHIQKTTLPPSKILSL